MWQRIEIIRRWQRGRVAAPACSPPVLAVADMELVRLRAAARRHSAGVCGLTAWDPMGCLITTSDQRIHGQPTYIATPEWSHPLAPHQSRIEIRL